MGDGAGTPVALAPAGRSVSVALTVAAHSHMRPKTGRKMPGAHSIVWIGSAESWAESGLADSPSLDVTWVRDADEAARLGPQHFDAAVVISEADANTEARVRRLRSWDDCPPLLVVARTGGAEDLQRFVSAGPHDVVLADPAVARGFASELHRQLERIAHARRPRRAGRARETSPPPPDGVIAHSQPMQQALALAARAATSTATVLIGGETGSGKEVVARAVHAGGPRARRSFVAVNCAAFPDTLLESELFGHTRGSFTGADRDKRGLFEEAEGGTLFLDEIGETSPPFQAKLLRVLQEREVRPIGGARSRKIDVRVVAASHRDLRAESARGAFRTDLYYRLAVFPIAVPPLRDRPDDVLPLAAHFFDLHGKQEHKPGCELSRAAQHLLLAYPWPGNVRELENEVQRALALVDAGEV